MKRNALNLSQKLDAIAQVKSGKRQVDVAKAFRISSATLSIILKNTQYIEDKAVQGSSFKAKRFRASTHKDIDEALLAWFKQARNQNLTVNGPLLMEKANQLAEHLQCNNFLVSTGY